jgi:hypothetical protein
VLLAEQKCSLLSSSLTFSHALINFHNKNILQPLLNTQETLFFKASAGIDELRAPVQKQVYFK